MVMLQRRPRWKSPPQLHPPNGQKKKKRRTSRRRACCVLSLHTTRLQAEGSRRHHWTKVLRYRRCIVRCARCSGRPPHCDTRRLRTEAATERAWFSLTTRGCRQLSQSRSRSRSIVFAPNPHAFGVEAGLSRMHRKGSQLHDAAWQPDLLHRSGRRRHAAPAAQTASCPLPRRQQQQQHGRASARFPLLRGALGHRHYHRHHQQQHQCRDESQEEEE